MNIKTVAVIGANGTMGSNVSAIFASFGDAKVYMISRDIEKSRQAVAKAVRSVRADSIAVNLIPADYSMMAECIAASDLVFESVSENFAVKADVLKMITPHLRPDAVIATGTSGLSITALAEVCPEYMRSRYFGVHMFNPPYNLTLCELMSTEYTDPEVLNALRCYLSGTLHRTVVEVKDSPAFLGNRIGFYFINRAMCYAEKYSDRGGVDYIDAIFGPFTGRNMAPIATADFVGLDVHKAIVDNVYENAPDYAKDCFVLPEYARKLIEEGKLGRKTRGGLYKLEIAEDNSKRMMVYDIASDTYRPANRPIFPFAEKMKKAFRTGNYQIAFEEFLADGSAEAEICLDFMLQYIVYSLYVVSAVGFDVHAADAAMATGFNWCPPLAMADAFNTVVDVKDLIRDRIGMNCTEDVDVEAILNMITPSRFDYRPYFKSN